MKRIVDPAQKGIFDPEIGNFSPGAYRTLANGWQGVFRRSLLELMPVAELGQEFSEDVGRPTKELYSLAGLVVIAQMKGWTSQEAAEAYMFDQSVQYALNVGHRGVELSARTVERFQRKFREQELAQAVFDRVARTLMRGLELAADLQRIDSTHVFSDMASLSRTQVMLACLRRFLAQLKRHHNAEYAQVDAALRARCEAKDRAVFGGCAKDESSRRNLRQQVAEDMLALVERFAAHGRIGAMTSYRLLERCLHEQCEVVEKKLQVRKKASGRTLQNPSDPDATINGHKGKGYQLQIAETYNPANPVQLITCAMPQTAADEDGEALPVMIEKLTGHGLKPERVLADAHYGSDENQQQCEVDGIQLVAPVRGKHPGPGYVAATDAQKRLEQRREFQQTEEWEQLYKPRAQIEGTNSGLKRRLDLGRLRVRGQKSVFCVLLLKATGWNVLRAAAAVAQQARKTKKKAKTALQGCLWPDSVLADAPCAAVAAFRILRSPCFPAWPVLPVAA